ncbi:MAG: M23 family metallopeptidase [Candidatus Kapabacteria bacterium]|nr:M23 family metallopeptidase [Candidatus Kapabacteria bacterium]
MKFFVLAASGIMLSMHCWSLDVRFSIPLRGVPGKDFVFVNHVDHDTTKGKFHSFNCDVHTYDGHDGTDLVIPSFNAMDSGVVVVAAADGQVIFSVDSLYDRNKVSVKERGFGNYIAIRHADGFVTYYAHIRANSSLVSAGEYVQRNQPIALVGSSGNSNLPHLHFEVWRRMDPFTGPCGDDVSLWQQQPDASVNHSVLDHGITTWPPVLDTLVERPPNTRVVDTTARTITAWSVHTGIKEGDEFTITWYSPLKTVWFAFTIPSELTTNLYYWWSYIDYTRATMQPGQWTVVVSLNGIEVVRDTFELPAIVSVSDEKGNHKPHSMSDDADVYFADGRYAGSDIGSLPDGTYVIRLRNHAHRPQSSLIIIRNGVVVGVSAADGRNR